MHFEGCGLKEQIKIKVRVRFELRGAKARLVRHQISVSLPRFSPDNLSVEYLSTQPTCALLPLIIYFTSSIHIVMLYYLITALCLAAVALGDHARLHLRDNCNSGYTQCSPQGASATDAPAIGSSLSGLYVDLLDSINKVQKLKRDDNHQFDIEIRASAAAVCCKLHKSK